MMWFGTPRGARYESECERIDTPLLTRCIWCDEPIAPDDDGLVLPFGGRLDAQASQHAAYHYACFRRTLIGGVNHVRRRCACYGGDAPPDPPELSCREAAQAALDAWEGRQP